MLHVVIEPMTMTISEKLEHLWFYYSKVIQYINESSHYDVLINTYDPNHLDHCNHQSVLNKGTNEKITIPENETQDTACVTLSYQNEHGLWIVLCDKHLVKKFSKIRIVDSIPVKHRVKTSLKYEWEY